MCNDKIDFRIKTINNDFQVTEVSLLPDFYSGSEEYTYVWIKKSNHTTFEAIEKIKSFFNIKTEDVSAEGLKDEDGITEQIMSIKKNITDEDVDYFNQRNNDGKTFIKIERILGTGAESVRPRSLHGNTFKVVIRNLTENQMNNINEYVQNAHFFSFINYYDNQRFGLPGGPYTTHLIGQAICKNDWDKAFAYLKESGNKIPEGKSGKEAFLGLNPSIIDFYISSYNSYLWNKEVSKRIGKTALAEYYDFPGIGELALPNTINDLSINVITIDGYGLNKENLSVFRSKKTRNVIISTAIYANQLFDDEIFHDRKKITLEFFLPTGCYATMIIKQIINKSLKEE